MFFHIYVIKLNEITLYQNLGELNKPVVASGVFKVFKVHESGWPF